MSENKMAEVSKLLGVELNEEFGLKNSNFRYKLTTYGLFKRYITLKEWTNSSVLDDLLLGKVEIIKIAKSILDPAEKRYLTNIIKPFRNNVKYIRKCRKFSGPYEYISIAYVDSSGDNVLNFPDFKANKMYKGMESDKLYKLKELGL